MNMETAAEGIPKIFKVAKFRINLRPITSNLLPHYTNKTWLSLLELPLAVRQLIFSSKKDRINTGQKKY